MHMSQALAADGARFTAIDRDDSAAMLAVLGDGADLLVDCVCYTAAQAATLLPLVSSVTSTVMISSKAVYMDANGRHANSDVPPASKVRSARGSRRCGRTMRRTTRVKGYGSNKVAAEEVLLDSGYPITVLRPSKVHGVWSRQPREWVFVKRILDKRPVLVLAQRGAGVDHPTAAANVAALIEFVVARPGRRILNSVRPGNGALEYAGHLSGHRSPPRP